MAWHENHTALGCNMIKTVDNESQISSLRNGFDIKILNFSKRWKKAKEGCNKVLATCSKLNLSDHQKARNFIPC